MQVWVWVLGSLRGSLDVSHCLSVGWSGGRSVKASSVAIRVLLDAGVYSPACPRAESDFWVPVLCDLSCGVSPLHQREMEPFDEESTLSRFSRAIGYDLEQDTAVDIDVRGPLLHFFSLVQSTEDTSSLFSLIPEVQLVVHEEFIRPNTEHGDRVVALNELVDALVAASVTQSSTPRLLELLPQFLSADHVLRKQLELLPSTGVAPSQRAHAASETTCSTRTIEALLKASWKPSMILPLFSTFVEMHAFFQPIQWQRLQRRLYEDIPSIPAHDFPGIIKSTLNMLDGSDARLINEGWVSLFRQLVSATPTSSSANAFLIIRGAMERSPHLCDEIVDIFNHMHDGVDIAHPTFFWSDVLIVLLASKCQGSTDSLIAVLMNSQRSHRPAAVLKSSSGLLTKSKRKRRSALHRKTPLRHRCWQSISAMLVTVNAQSGRCVPRQDGYLSMLQFANKVVTTGILSAGTEFVVSIAPDLIRMSVAWCTLAKEALPKWLTSDNIAVRKRIQRLGGEVLCTMFSAVPACQQEIVNLAFQYKHTVVNSSLASRASIVDMFGKTLHRIGHVHTVMLSKHVEQVQEWLAYILGPAVANDRARSTLAAVVPLVRYNRHFADYLLVRLRKMTSSRRLDGQQLAVDSLCDLLKFCHLLRPDTHVQVVEILTNVCFMSFSLRRQVMMSINLAIEGIADRPLGPAVGSSASSPIDGVQKWPLATRATDIVQEMLWRRFLALFARAEDEMEWSGGPATNGLLGKDSRKKKRRRQAMNQIPMADLGVLRFDASRCFRVVQVKGEDVYEQTGSPAQLLACLFSLELALGFSDRMKVLLTQLLDAFQKHDVVPTIPLQERLKICMPLCIVLAETCLIRENLIHHSNDQRILTNVVSLESLPLHVDVAIQMFELAGIFDILCQVKYDVPSIIKGELNLMTDGALYQPWKSRTMRSKLWVLESFGNRSFSNPKPSIIAALHASRFFARQIQVRRGRGSHVQIDEGDGEFMLTLFKTCTQAYSVASKTDEVSIGAEVGAGELSSLLHGGGNRVSVFTVAHNFLHRSYLNGSGPFCPTVLNWVKSNVTESECADTPLVSLLRRSASSKSKQAKRCTDEPLLFFEFRFNLITSIEHLLRSIVEEYRPHRTALLLRDTVFALADVVLGDRLPTTVSDGADVSGKNVFSLLGSTFATQIAQDVRTSTGSFPELILRQLDMLDYCLALQKELLDTRLEQGGDASDECITVFSCAAPMLAAMLLDYKIESKKIFRKVLEFIIRAAKALCPADENVCKIASAVIHASLNPARYDVQNLKNTPGPLASHEAFRHTLLLVRNCDFTPMNSRRLSLPVGLAHHRDELMAIFKSALGKKRFLRGQTPRSRVMALILGPSVDVSALQRKLMVDTCRVVVADLTAALAHDTFDGLTKYVLCDDANLVDFISAGAAYLNNTWSPQLLQQTYQMLISTMVVVALAGQEICQALCTGKGKMAGGDSIWPVVSQIFKLMLFGKLWLERVQASHAYVQKKAAEALLGKEKFEMQLFIMCGAHQKYVSGDHPTENYDESFVALVKCVCGWQKSTTKSVASIVHRPAIKKRRGKSLRSRNQYIDQNLEVESGNDTFADLEDFIVDEDDEVD